MRILVVNAGSSNVKYEVVEFDGDSERRVARGRVATVEEAVGQPHGEVDAVGHRVTHGGERHDSVRIDDAVRADIARCAELAPLHNPANLHGIEVAQASFPDVPHVAVFDTAFHATMPETSYLYGLPRRYHEELHVRRYGFHGISHQYLLETYCQQHGRPRDEVNLITLHLGNGGSACAIKNGKSYDTSMGFTPLEGLLMGTRSGDLDPSIPEYLARREGTRIEEFDQILNKESGLLGVSGLSGDMRELLEAERKGHAGAHRAIEMFCYRVRKYIGAYHAALGGAEAVIFAGGIGENAPEIRKRIECLGLRYEVIPTDEELVIARDTLRVIGSSA